MTENGFAARLLAARAAMGLGRTDMARRVRGPAQLPSIRDWELGGSLPRREMLATIARAYAIPRAELAALHEAALRARETEGPMRPLCGDCESWRAEARRVNVPLVDIAVRMGWCAAHGARRERCDWCLAEEAWTKA